MTWIDGLQFLAIGWLLIRHLEMQDAVAQANTAATAEARRMRDCVPPDLSV